MRSFFTHRFRTFSSILFCAAFLLIPVQVHAHSFSAISAGGWHSLAVKEDGSLWAWGLNSDGQLGDGTTTTHHNPVQIGEGFTVIAAGGYHSLGLKTDGSLWAWGANKYGQLGDGTTTYRYMPVLIDEDFAVCGYCLPSESLT